MARICRLYGVSSLAGRLSTALFLAAESLSLESLCSTMGVAKRTASVALRKLEMLHETTASALAAIEKEAGGRRSTAGPSSAARLVLRSPSSREPWLERLEVSSWWPYSLSGPR